jgi:hypothetical protein
VQGVHRLGEVLDFTKSKRKIERMLLQRVHRVEDPNNQRLFEISTRSACRDPFGGLEFASESSEGIEPLKCPKGDGGRNHLT